MSKKIKVVILISGNGSNMRALINDMNDRDHPATPTLVISDRPNALGLLLAQSLNIKTAVVNYKEYPDKKDFENELATLINSTNSKVICLAGFMQILSPYFVSLFKNRILNIHPSILPLFKGLKTHKKALESGMFIHGTTVHLVTDELDNGKILGQGVTRIFKNDTEKVLAERVLKLEHKLYPITLRNFLQKKTARIIISDI